MRLSTLYTGRAEVKRSLVCVSVLKKLKRNEVEGNGEDGEKGDRQTGYLPVTTQATNMKRDDCEDDDDDEDSKKSATSTQSATPSSTIQVGIIPDVPLILSTLLPPPAPPSAITTASLGIESTTSPAPIAPPAASTTREISTSTSQLVQSSSTTIQTTQSSSASSNSRSFLPTIIISSATTLSTAISSQSPLATIIRPSISVLGTGVSSQTDRTGPSAAANGISSAGIGNKQIGVTIGAIVVALATFAGIIMLGKYCLSRQKKKDDEGLPPSSPVHRRSVSENQGIWTPDIEQTRPQNPSHSLSSIAQSATSYTRELFQATSTPTVSSKYLGLNSNPVTQQIVQEDGSIKTIIKPVPYQTVKQVTIHGKKETPKIQQTDLYIEGQAGEIHPGDRPETLNQKTPPLRFDMLGVDEGGNAEKRKTLLLEHKPGGRWSDPFTMAWRGSGEASEGGTRWKSAQSWVVDQNRRLNDSDMKQVASRKSKLGDTDGL